MLKLVAMVHKSFVLGLVVYKSLYYFRQVKNFYALPFHLVKLLHIFRKKIGMTDKSIEENNNKDLTL